MNIELLPENKVEAEFVGWPPAVDRVLYEAEQPIVFLTHSASGQSLLAYLAHESSSCVDYILASASPRKVQQLEQGGIGVREALCSDWMWIMRYQVQDSTHDIWVVTESEIPDEYLPVPGTGLLPEHSVVFAARALGDGIALGRMPCSVISLVADSEMKKVIDNILIFGFGGIFILNIDRLTSAGDGFTVYQASWFNAFLSIAFALSITLFKD